MKSDTVHIRKESFYAYENQQLLIISNFLKHSRNKFHKNKSAGIIDTQRINMQYDTLWH